ncbi:tetratricopeptide repeat protein [Yoonia sp. 2307UL14-13]|uniref:tetratricopeptide repeat protein n=1 Tax=Yoonia sp. 2307UL14-13 TaxID=3126506 RepID=UPI0030974B32
MMQDIFGQETTLTDAKALDSWNKTQLAFLAHGASTPTHLGVTIEAEPHFVLGHVAKAMFYILLGRRELLATAEEAFAAAEAGAKAQPISKREMHFLNALREWMAGQPLKALLHFEAAIDDNPTDIFALKLDHALRFVFGDSTGMRRMIEKVRPAYSNTHVGYGYLLGCHAFALEETGAYNQAQIAGREALLLAPDDAWGLHAVAHVHDMTADAAGGIKWLTGREEAWAHCNNFRYHVWWHKALMHLDLGEKEVVLDLYDQQIRKDKTDDYRDISNATSLLSRLELDGIDVGDRWDELADLSANRTEDGCLIFADLHYLLALVGGKRDDAITSMMGRLHRDAKESRTDMQKAMACPGMAAATGLEAFGEAQFETAFVNLAQANKNLQAAGGSHAQRDVFERLTIDSGIRAGYLDEAEAILAKRTAQRNGRIDGYAAARQKLISDGRRAAGGAAHVVA